MSSDQSESNNQSASKQGTGAGKANGGTRRGGDMSAAAAQNGKRVGRPTNPARKAVTEARRLTYEAQEETARKALAAAAAAGDLALVEAVVRLETVLANAAPLIAALLLELCKGVVVQEADKAGNPRIYSTPPNVTALIYCSNRIAGTPVSKTELHELYAKEEARLKASQPVFSREDALKEVALMLLENMREMRGTADASQVTTADVGEVEAE